MNSEKNLCEAWDKKKTRRIAECAKKKEKERKERNGRGEKKEENFQPNKELN